MRQVPENPERPSADLMVSDTDYTGEHAAIKQTRHAAPMRKAGSRLAVALPLMPVWSDAIAQLLRCAGL